MYLTGRQLDLYNIIKKFIDAANIIGNGAKIEGLETFNGINFERRKDFRQSSQI